MMTLFFTEERVVDYDSAIKSDTEKFSQYFQAMLKQGIMLPPSQFEALFISTEHTIEDLDYTIEAYNESIQNLK
jgi:glutamate-1-semialdehyde 2,1-aminomutase